MVGPESGLNDDEVVNSEIPISRISRKTMDKILVFMRYHEHLPMQTFEKPLMVQYLRELVGDWDAEYTDVEDTNELLLLIKGANYIHCKPLLDLGTAHLALLIRGKTQEEVKQLFGLKEILSPAKVEEILNANSWIFEVCKEKRMVAGNVEH